MKRWALIVLALLVAGISVVWFLRVLERVNFQAQVTREMSKMMSVRYIVSPAFNAYYTEYGQYPEKLRDLKLEDLSWGIEGSSVEDLDEWQYQSDGESFVMIWEHKSEIRLFFAGRAGILYFQEDEFEQKVSQQSAGEESPTSSEFTPDDN